MNLKHAKVTVIIPCYNREDFICQAINSVLSQTYDNIEILAVDDGCTDSTRTILESYGDRIRILEHPGRVNRGQSAAINLAMRSTKSEYVAILDSDDYWASTKLEKQVKYLKSNPDIGLVYSNEIAVDERNKKLYELFPIDHVETNSPERVLLDCYFRVPTNAIVRKSAFDLAGEFDEALRSAQDHDMAIRLVEVTKMAYIDEKLSFYRRHTCSLSQTQAKRRWDAGFKILNKALKRYPYGFNIRRKRLAVLNFRIGQCLVEEGRFLRAAVSFSYAGLFDPLRAIRVIFRMERANGLH